MPARDPGYKKHIIHVNEELVLQKPGSLSLAELTGDSCAWLLLA